MMKNPNVENFLKKKKSPIYNRLVGQIKYMNNNWERFVFPEALIESPLRDDILTFIEGGIKMFRGVMIISTTNKTRSIQVAAIYLMMKYKWSARKTLEYLSIKKPDLEITTEILAAF